GLRRLFSPATASRLGFGVLKIVVIGAVAAVDLYAKRETLLALSGGSVAQIASFASAMLLWTSLKIGAALLALALADYGLQRWKHERDLRMTPQELREELRDLEGDPAVRSLQRRMRQELVSDRLLAAVSRADVVLAGASGAAVAIRYNPESSVPPVLVAKGAGELAQRIRRRAVAHGVAVIDRRRLAETLDREVEPGRPIPREHYAAVARILAQVHHQQGRELPEAA
ncbi:MAG: EscU/YscU/HrcU family type III secretion system export apparatus switch protein, partial [Pirellulales bacterium]|nr:EscU/YscU/HrcU family type III secretion system export apparatus switch protein [Pirellulales bacterium]